MTAGPGDAVPDPPNPLVCNLSPLSEGTVLHRIHDRRFGSCLFNPGLGYTRFAPCVTTSGKIPTLYAGTSLGCAIFEYIFHDVETVAPFKSVPHSSLDPLSYSTVQLARDLNLATFFKPDLLKLSLERRQLIDSPKSTYDQTQKWSPAVHRDSSADGMIWTSHRFDEEKALMLFGDRVTDRDLVELSSVDIINDPDILHEIYSLAKRADIVLSK